MKQGTWSNNRLPLRRWFALILQEFPEAKARCKEVRFSHEKIFSFSSTKVSGSCSVEHGAGFLATVCEQPGAAGWSLGALQSHRTPERGHFWGNTETGTVTNRPRCLSMIEQRASLTSVPDLGKVLGKGLMVVVLIAVCNKASGKKLQLQERDRNGGHLLGESLGVTGRRGRTGNLEKAQWENRSKWRFLVKKRDVKGQDLCISSTYLEKATCCLVLIGKWLKLWIRLTPGRSIWSRLVSECAKAA